jgi:hypothetical protein
VTYQVNRQPYDEDVGGPLHGAILSTRRPARQRAIRIAGPVASPYWLSRAGWRPSLTDLRLGWESYGDGSDPLWFDDVAVGSSRIGC